ncbi:MAG: DUF86 domain-containing protein [Symploca sp. SIO1B1]|nr:DUF86 domain-containing protein [Symploca sp. SIO1C2]NES01108.1 DUF86 domain-containing protein [Symploca sp. SIO1B1]
MNNRDAGYLWDMVQAIKNIQEFLGNVSYNDYLDSILLQSAVERQLEVLGEAARRISDVFQQAHPEIDWRGTIGLRNIIAHQYDKVEQETLWAIVQSELPELLKLIEPLLPPLPDNELQ